MLKQSPLRRAIYPTKHYFNSKFDITAMVNKQAEESDGGAASPDSHAIEISRGSPALRTHALGALRHWNVALCVIT